MEDLERGLSSNNNNNNNNNEEEEREEKERERNNSLDLNILPSKILRTKTSLSEPLYKPSNSSSFTSYKRNKLERNEENKENNNYNKVKRSSSFDIRLYSQQNNNNENNNENNRIRSWRNLLPLPLLRTISSNPPPVIELCYCGICLENHPKYDCIKFSRCITDHSFCYSSLKTYFETQINEGILHHPCPSCNKQTTENELRQIISEETYSKFLRFLEMKANPGYRECPKCSYPTIGNLNELTIICAKCSETYCFIHSNAHPNRTCQEYIQSQRRTEAKNLQFIKRMSRKCPSCGCDTEKNGGCNHMKCRQCDASWCWLCGRDITNIVDHYDAITGCPGGQFSDAPEWALWTIFPCLRSTCFHHLTRIPYFLFLIYFLPIMLITTILSFFTSIPIVILFFPFILCYKRCCRSISSYEKKCYTIMKDSFLYLIVLLNAGLILLNLYLTEIIWLPFALLLSIIVYPSYLLSRRNRLDTWTSFFELSRRYFTFIDPDRVGYTNIYWCFPLSCFEYLIKTSLKDFIMLVSLKLEEQNSSR